MFNDQNLSKFFLNAQASFSTTHSSFRDDIMSEPARSCSHEVWNQAPLTQYLI